MEEITLESLKQEIEQLKERNKKVEAEKLWETSIFRKISIIVITYVFMVIVMYFLKLWNPFIWAIIPTIGYFLSTLSLWIIKKIYLKKMWFNFSEKEYKF